MAYLPFLKTTTGTLTNAQLKALGTTAIQIIPAQGAGVVIAPVSLVLKLVYGGNNAFGNNPQIEVQYSATPGNAVTGTLFLSSAFSNATNNAYSTLVSYQLGGASSAAMENNPLYIAANASFTGNAANDNTIKYSMVWYLQAI
jgi:hypothetical protein